MMNSWLYAIKSLTRPGEVDFPSKDVALWLFKELNVRARKEKTTDERYAAYWFNYQNAEFRLVVMNDGEEAFIQFNHVLSEKYAYQQAILNLCNVLNRSYEMSFYCTYDEKTHQVSVHISSHLLLNKKDEKNKKRFTDVLGEMFSLRRIVREEFDSLRRKVDAKKNIDVFDQADMQNRGGYLLYEHEMKENMPAFRSAYSDAELSPKRVLSIFDVTLNEENIDEISLVFSHQNCKKIPLSAFGSYDMAEELRSACRNLEQGKKQQFETMLAVSSTDGVYRAIWTWQSESKTCEYFSLTVLRPWKMQPNADCKTIESTVVLHALEKSEAGSRAEAKFMVDDAMDKRKNGKMDELTPEQTCLLDFLDWSVLHHVYWGMKYFYSKDFFRAILHLEIFVQHALPIVDTLSKQQRETVLDACYKLGYSYNDMRIYSKAFYYLRIPYGYGQMYACMEFINCLVNSNDYRAEYEIDVQLNDVTTQLDKYEDDEFVSNEQTQLSNYRFFLIRRKVFVLLRKRKTSDARSYLESLLKDENEEIKDYAQAELKKLTIPTGNDTLSVTEQ